MLTYFDPPQNIGITCQNEPFDIESLRDTLQGEHNTGPMQEERLERIPSVKKLVGHSSRSCPSKKLNTRYANTVIFGPCTQTAQ